MSRIKKYKRYRSSVTGRFVTYEWALAHPRLTVSETYEIELDKDEDDS